VAEHETADQKRRMLAWAARARANPRFDREEREHRLEVARMTTDVLEAVAGKEPIGERVRSLYSFMRPRLPELVVPRQLAHLTRWVAEDEEGLAWALRSFNERDLAPAERLARFAAAFQAREQGEAGVLQGIVLGSLFNFATAPGELPIVRPGVFSALAETLGGTGAVGTAGERYARHLAFGREIQGVLAEAGVPVRDQIDAEALILICWQDHEFWGSDEDGRRPRATAPEHYLAACAIYRDEAEYLAEWIEFHRLVGFERFYLYDNLSADHHLDVLDPYIKDGIVVLHDWPHYPGQFAAYDHCVASYGDDCRWIGFFDIDEFVFSPAHRPVPEVLADYEQWPAVCVNVPRFGTSGHRTRPEGLVIENYVVRVQTLAERTVKSIVDPAAVDRCLNAHEFAYHRRSAVDTEGFPVHSTATKSPSLDRLRANHYYSKSEEELRLKHTRRTADYARERRPLPDPPGLAEREAELGVRDEAILHYAEPLREALARRARV
jgi:glycosyl transferase family 92